MSKSITADMRRNVVYQGKSYGPGQGIEIPLGLAAALGISASGTPLPKPASAGAPDAVEGADAVADASGAEGSARKAASKSASKEAGRSAAAEPVDYAGMTKAELEDEAERRGVTVEGSGSGGAVLKSDLVDALSAADEG